MILKSAIPALFNQIRQGATFLSIKEYFDNYDGLADYGIVFHVDYKKAVKKSLDIMESYRAKNELEAQARLDLIYSFKDTLAGFNPRALSAHAYSPISDGQNPIKSVKWHDNGTSVHLWGFIVHKREIRLADYPADERSEWAITRRALKAETPIIRFRQFKISKGRFKTINVEKLTLDQKALIKSVNHYM